MLLRPFSDENVENMKTKEESKNVSRLSLVWLMVITCLKPIFNEFCYAYIHKLNKVCRVFYAFFRRDCYTAYFNDDDDGVSSHKFFVLLSCVILVAVIIVVVKSYLHEIYMTYK